MNPRRVPRPCSLFPVPYSLVPRPCSLFPALSIHFSQHNVHASEDQHNVGHVFAQGHIFKNGQIDQTWRTNSITIWIRPSVTDEIEAQFALGRSEERRVGKECRSR